MLKLEHYKKAIIGRLQSWKKLNPGWTWDMVVTQSEIIAKKLVESVNGPGILQLARDPELLHYEMNIIVLESTPDITLSDIAKIVFRQYLLGCAQEETEKWRLEDDDGEE